MININELKFTVLQQDILRFLFIKAGTSFTARAIAKALHVSPPAISKALPLLEKQRFLNVKKDRESRRLSIELNRDNFSILGIKRADNLWQLYECGLVHFLRDAFPGACIIIFGSYAHGDDTVSSDIDLAIVGVQPKKINAAKYETALEREIILNYYPSFAKIDKYLLNNILNGITLVGAVEL